MVVNPLTRSFVADITSVDLRDLEEQQFARLYSAWLEFGVLRVRDQNINEDELQSFSARFGPLGEIPFGRMPDSEKAKVKNRYVTQLSNIIVDGKPVGGLGNTEASWHSDMTYVAAPRPRAFCWLWKLHRRVEIHTLQTNVPPTRQSQIN